MQQAIKYLGVFLLSFLKASKKLCFVIMLGDVRILFGTTSVKAAVASCSCNQYLLSFGKQMQIVKPKTDMQPVILDSCIKH